MDNHRLPFAILRNSLQNVTRLYFVAPKSKFPALFRITRKTGLNHELLNRKAPHFTSI